MGSHWYEDAVLYEVDVRAFYDSNGDGIGDIPGLIDKLHYLRELGVTALVLGPRQHCWLGNGSSASPSKSAVQDFERLVAAAHARRMHVISELLVDQASDQALDADLLPTRAGFESAIRRWLDAGVDGVKIDVSPTLVDLERSGALTIGARGIVKEARALIDQHYAERVLIVEANQSPDDVSAYFGRGDQCHMASNMSVMPRLLMAMKQENRSVLMQALRRMTDIPASCQWAMVLRHHEELSLESCTEAERDEIYGTYASEPRMRFHTGIRRRLAPLFDNDLALDVDAGTQPLELLGGATFRRIGADPYSVTLGPYGCLWLLMQRLATRPSTSFDMATVAPGSQSGETDAPAARAGRLPYREVCERTQ